MFLGGRQIISPLSSYVAGVSLSVLGDPAAGDVCHIAPSGGGRPKFPPLFGLGADGGWTAGAARMLRVGVSPYWNLKVEGGAGVGLHAQADFAVSSLVFALRGVALPNMHGAALFMATFTLGLRWN